MIAEKTRKAFLLIVIVILTVVSGCTQNSENTGRILATESPFNSFREIPEVTEQEIAAIEALISERDFFTYGMILSSEAFWNENGEVGGYTALFCEWLTDLFGIPFIPQIYSTYEMLEHLHSGNIDFSGHIMPTAERREAYYLTETIAERQFVTVRIAGSRDLDEIANERPLRFVFIDNTIFEEVISSVTEPGRYEPIWASDYLSAYQAIESGEADAYITVTIADAFFIGYENLVIENYMPIVFNPASMAAFSSELEHVISVVSKAMRNGAMPYLNHLYIQGHQEYRKHAMSLLLTDEERAYIAANPVIPIATFNTDYPLSFWNERENEWQGAFIDILDEVSTLTGLVFDVAHDEHANIAFLNALLADGEVFLIPNLTWTAEREERFVWSDFILMEDNLALISKSSFRNITLNEILHVRVGVAQDTIHAATFNQWFPNHNNIVEFEGIYDALGALMRDEVDMVMSGQRRVLHLTHFQEMPEFKANVIFDYPNPSRVAFLGDEAILRDIFDKALTMTDIERITYNWIQRTYDYRAKLADEQRPLLIGSIILALLLFVFILIFFIRSYIVTRKVNKQRNLLEAATKEKELHLLKLNMAIKSAKIALWDMYVSKDDPVNPANLIIYSDEFRYMLEYTNDIDFPNVLSSWSDLLHPEDKEETLAAFAKHMLDKTGKTPFDVEYRLLKKSGEYGYFHAAGVTIRDEDGNPIQVSGALIDITKTQNMIKAIEQQRDESEFRMHEFISKFSVPFTQPIDFNETINNALIELRDFTKTDRAIILEFVSNDLLHCTFESVINENTPSVLGNSLLYEEDKLIFDRADETGCFYEKEAERYFEETNSRGWGEKSFCCIPLTISGNRAGYLIFFAMFEQANWSANEFHLVTMAGSIIAGAYSRKLSEEIMNASREAETRTQEFIAKFSVPFTQPYNFDDLINNALYELMDFTKTDRAVILEYQTDDALSCTYESILNEKTPSILGRTLLYKDIKFVLDIAEETGCLYEKDSARYFPEGHAAHLGSKSFCCIPLMVEGERAGYLVFFTLFEHANWAEGEFRLVTMTGSIIAGAFAIRKNDELREAAIKAQQASEAKSSFLSVMSHEIRTPMNAILGITEILIRDESASENIVDGLHRIYYSCNLLLKIINDILDLSKIEAGMLELNPYKYETASLINDIVMLNLMRIGSKSIEFELSVDENLPLFMVGDELRIKQILENLLSNAFKYTDEGKIKLSFSIEKEIDDADLKLVVVVSDTGQGMTEEQLNTLFDEYTRFNYEANRTTQGTGLGMSIVKNLTQLMNGDVDVKSKKDEGTTITVRLSQEYCTSEILGKELAENLQNYQQSGLRQMKKAQMLYEPMPYGSILIVDDVESNLFVAKGLMSPYKLNFDTAKSGFEAIEKVKNGNVYDIIFMDHMMPKMDGIEATKRIRKHGYKHPVVALTANAVSGRRELFLSNGFDDFISKPIDIRQLNDILKRFVRDKQSPEILDAIKRETEQREPVGTFGSVQKVLKSDDLVKVVISDIENALTALMKIMPSIDNANDEYLNLYTTTVHGMKSALANIGELELSKTASKLEEAGNEKKINTILDKTPDFMNALLVLINKIKPMKKDSEEKPNDDIPLLHEKINEIVTACNNFNKKAARKALDDLKKKSWSKKIEDILDEISMDLLRGDFDKVLVVAENQLNMKQ